MEFDEIGFGERVREKRKAQGLTQAELAALCDVGTRFVSDLENGKASVELGLALRVVRGVGLTPFLKPKSWSELADLDRAE